VRGRRSWAFTRACIQQPLLKEKASARFNGVNAPASFLWRQHLVLQSSVSAC
jgi:hypothetical protein